MHVMYRFGLIVILTSLALVFSLPKHLVYQFQIFGQTREIRLSSPQINLTLGNTVFHRDLMIRQGLDLQGGTQLVLRAEMASVAAADRDTALEAATEVIHRRVDLYGIVEPTVQTSTVGEEHRILVELPGVENNQQAIDLVGKTAQLDFRQIPLDLQDATPSSVPLFLYESTGLTGADLKKAQVEFGSGDGVSTEPVVSIMFTQEGQQKFAVLTKANIGKPIAIFLDEIPVTAPEVREAIPSGQAVISGTFTTESAKQLAIQLNAGALPVPVQIIEQRTIGPTLGAESVQKSLIAGMLGLVIVMTFMVTYYGKLGLYADIALVIYGLITLAIYKLIPITLTLPGIAGFILSVGMAVDANILIFERMREELRNGRHWKGAMELGFGRAWDSIKDANVATILTAMILLNPLNLQWLVTSGMVRGFALTLLVGVLISMFTGVVVTRTLMRVFYKG